MDLNKKLKEQDADGQGGDKGQETPVRGGGGKGYKALPFPSSIGKRKAVLERSPPSIFSTSPRTPGDSANKSTIEYVWDEELGSSVKRPKTGDSPSMTWRDSMGPEVTLHARFIRNMKKLDEAVGKLGALVKKHRNTQVDIKTATDSITSIMSSCMTAETRRIWEGRPERISALITVSDSVEAGVQTEGQAGGDAAKKPSRSIATQTGEVVAEEVERLCGRLKEEAAGGHTLEGFMGLADCAWPKEVYTAVSVDKEEITALPNEWDLAVLVTGDFVMERGTRRVVRDRYRGTSHLINQNVEPGGATYLTDCINIPGKEENEKTVLEQYVFYGVIGETYTDVPNMQDIFRSVGCIKDLMRREGRTRLALSTGGMVNVGTMKKMVEYLFRGSGVEVKLMVEGDSAGRDRGGRGDNKTAERKANRRRIGTRDDAVIVKVEEGKSYADLLRVVKRDVDLQEAGVQLGAVRKTRGGDLLMTVKHKDGGDQAKVLKELIARKVAGATVQTRGKDPSMTLHVNGLDAVVREEELRGAVQEALPSLKGEVVKVNALWPAFGETQNASITLPKEGARELLREGRLRVGWLTCRVRERVEVTHCFRCWGNGHLSSNCSGKDRRSDCRKCGATGYMAKDCRGPEKCWSCLEEGHRGNTTRCPAFRARLNGRANRESGGGETPTALRTSNYD